MSAPRLDEKFSTLSFDHSLDGINTLESCNKLSFILTQVQKEHIMEIIEIYA